MRARNLVRFENERVELNRNFLSIRLQRPGFELSRRGFDGEDGYGRWFAPRVGASDTEEADEGTHTEG